MTLMFCIYQISFLSPVEAAFLPAQKALVRHYNLLIDWEIIEQSPTEQLINYSGVLVPFEPEEKQLLLETKSLFDRCKTLESLFQSYQFQNNQDSNSSELH